MPTYTFKCEKCEREVEKIQSMASTSNQIYQICTCDSHQHKFTKIIRSAIPLHFKGEWNDKQ